MKNEITRLLNWLGQLIKREGNLLVNVLYYTKTNQSAKYSVQRGFNFKKHDFVRVKSTTYASLHHLYSYFSLLLPTCPLSIFLWFFPIRTFRMFDCEVLLYMYFFQIEEQDILLVIIFHKLIIYQLDLLFTKF